MSVSTPTLVVGQTAARDAFAEWNASDALTKSIEQLDRIAFRKGSAISCVLVDSGHGHDRIELAGGRPDGLRPEEVSDRRAPLNLRNGISKLTFRASSILHFRRRAEGRMNRSKVMSKSNGKVALVTGSSRGIGAEVARRLSKDGFAVVVNYAGHREPAEALVKQLVDAGGRAIAVAADVSDSAAVKQMFEVVEKELGGLDVLVNNAGVMSLAPIAEMDDASFDRQVAINLKGTFNTLREGAKRIRKGGRIVNFSTSVLGLQLPSYGAYVATKAAVEALTTVLAKELRGREITVNSVAPGPTATDLFFKGKSDGLVEKMSKQPPLERLGQPADIARVVSFLAGEDGGWVNGQTVRANGGIV